MISSPNFQLLKFNSTKPNVLRQVKRVDFSSNDKVSFKGAFKPEWNVEVNENAKKSILDFLEDIQSHKPIGKGADGSVYKITSVEGFPIGVAAKISHSTPINEKGEMQRVGKDFTDEKDILVKLPESLKDSQRIIGYVPMGDNKYCLLTTFVEGKKADPVKNPLKPEHLKSLLNSLSKLDFDTVVDNKPALILHRDLKKDNWFITQGNANQEAKTNLIDYGSSIVVDPTDTKTNSDVHNFPSFSMASNIRNFEDTGLFPYLKDLSAVSGPKVSRELFVDYLTLRADHHEKASNYLAGLVEKGHPNLQEAQRYEELQAKLFKKPSDELVDLEATKIQMTSSAEDAYRNEVLERNPLANITLKFWAMINAKKLDVKVNDMLNKPQTPEMREYLGFQKRLVDYRLKEKLSCWTGGLVGWVMENLAGKQTALQDQFLKPNLTKFEIPDVAGNIEQGKSVAFAGVRKHAAVK